MTRKNTEELNQFTYEQVAEKVDGWRRDLFGLRLSSASSHVKDISQFKKLRRNIARGLTIMQEKKMIAIMQMINEMLQKNIQEEQV
ncbi:50S ribosomal protein L29 [bacterium]|nr:50S ribosomal protein L29 [bacterium]